MSGDAAGIFLGLYRADVGAGFYDAAGGAAPDDPASVPYAGYRPSVGAEFDGSAVVASDDAAGVF